MRNKSHLALMEQLIMLMVFAIAAALCLQIFALSGRISKNIETRDRAIIAVQNAAESIKISNGDFGKCASFYGGTASEDSWNIYYDANWEIASSDSAVYCITANISDNDTAYLGTADVSAATLDGEVLFKVTASWQEVAP